MRVDFSEMLDRTEFVVLVEVLLRTEWKENFLREDVLDGCGKVGLFADAIGSKVGDGEL